MQILESSLKILLHQGFADRLLRVIRDNSPHLYECASCKLIITEEEGWTLRKYRCGKCAGEIVAETSQNVIVEDTDEGRVKCVPFVFSIIWKLIDEKVLTK